MLDTIIDKFNDNPLFMLLLIAVLIGVIFNAIRLIKRTIAGAFMLIVFGIIATMLLVKTGFLDKDIVDRKILDTKNELVEKAGDITNDAMNGITESIGDAASNLKEEVIEKTVEKVIDEVKNEGDEEEVEE